MQNPSESPFQGDPPPFDKGGFGYDKLFDKFLFDGGATGAHSAPLPVLLKCKQRFDKLNFVVGQSWVIRLHLLIQFHAHSAFVIHYSPLQLTIPSYYILFNVP